jgi:hypothetical protein
MKTMLLVAAAALSLGIGSAYASESEGQSGGYAYPDYQFPMQKAPSVGAAQNGGGIQTYVTQSSHGTWLFPPSQNGGGGNS